MLQLSLRRLEDGAGVVRQPSWRQPTNAYRDSGRC
jgi:hypothetical protein